MKAKADALTQDLEHRWILVSFSPNQLRCGKNNEGNFNLKEAKHAVTCFNFMNTELVWKELWQTPHWMKIKLFIWLMHQRKILTSENLLKKGFIGLPNVTSVAHMRKQLNIFSTFALSLLRCGTGWPQSSGKLTGKVSAYPTH